MASLGLLKELIKLPTRADNSQSAREVQGTGQARSCNVILSKSEIYESNRNSIHYYVEA